MKSTFRVGMLIVAAVLGILASIPGEVSARPVLCAYHEACPVLTCCCLSDTGLVRCVESVEECSAFCGGGLIQLT